MTNAERKMKMVLLVIDTQKGIMDDRLFAFEKVRENINRLIESARRNKIEVVFVRHDDGPGTGFSVGDEDFEIFSEFSPLDGERVFDKKVNSALHPSVGLQEYLDEKKVKQIIVTGLQTDFCIDATIKTGFDCGYTVIVPEHANSTFDNPYMDKEKLYHYYNEFVWKDRYAKILKVDDVIEMFKES